MNPVPHHKPVLWLPITSKVGALALAMLLPATELSALELPSIFSDHMVLQQGRPVAVWGRGASPGGEVVVSFGPVTGRATAGEDGLWRSELPPMPASADPGILRVRSETRELVFSDVLVGEVWLCAGQSNMVWRLGKSSDASLETATANRPALRILTVDRALGPQDRWSTKSNWIISSQESAPSFSAVAYRFGVTLQEALDVPVGLIVSAWGGTPLIAWHRLQAMSRHPLLAESATDWEKNMPGFPARLASWEKAITQFRIEHGLAPDASLDPKAHPNAPKRPLTYDPSSSQRPGTLAAGMIAPIAPFSVRGMLWYQGESDVKRSPETYHERLAVLVADWREWFEYPTMPVGVVQLASFSSPADDPSNHPWAILRESQRQFSIRDPHSGLVATLDAGEADDIHPADKSTVGRRLARWALADVYDLDLPNGGPIPASSRVEGSSMVIRFTNAAGGLRALHGGPLGGFSIAAEEGNFHPASAEICKDGESVNVRAEGVAAPRHVRYAWSDNPTNANLVNQERLPAPTFELKTDTHTSFPPEQDHTNPHASH